MIKMPLFTKCVSILLFLWLGTGSLLAELRSQSFNLEPLVERLERIKEMGESTGQTLSYSRTIIHGTAPGFTAETNNMEEWLDNSLKDSDYSYEKVADREYVVKFKGSATTSTKSDNLLSVNQEAAISGVVTDAFDNQPIPGVNVLIAGTSTGTTTDIDGVYELRANEGDTLVFSFIGYQTQRILVDKVRLINVRLSEHTEMLEEAVIVAFGKQSKESVISSITTVNTGDLKVPSSNLTTALSGKMAGLIAYQSTGAPGEEDAQFFVRSVTSFGSGLTSPLILIDNIEMTSRDLSRLNPDDIASFSILKDASATALYGARGANGVVLVTTKEGVKGAVNV